ncbi:MAG: hypothetical protein ACT4OM_10145 [Actinomycetota bacterium]
MIADFTPEELADWAEKKRVRSHLTDGRADPAKCNCAGANCLAAQAVADHFRDLDRERP